LRASQTKLKETLRDKPTKADVARLKGNPAYATGDSKREALEKKVKQEQAQVKKQQNDLAKSQ